MIVIECDRCKEQMNREDAYLNIRLHNGPGTVEARGHLCMACVQWLLKEMNDLPVVHKNVPNLKERMKEGKD